ncbi:hypothetical protein LCGC14_1846450 [marine sediment metagenome]|uniref:Uncharacterized protein n=1 Tax=marine sediment metagenome TaxID=412755 RepID=A0A0F9JAX5_9ZZZZ
MATESQPPFTDEKTSTTVGTPVALTAREIVCSSVTIKAKKANTNPVFVEDTSQVGTNFPLDGAETVTIPINDPRKILIDVTTSGEGVDWIAV